MYARINNPIDIPRAIISSAFNAKEGAFEAAVKDCGALIKSLKNMLNNTISFLGRHISSIRDKRLLQQSIER